MNAQPHTHWYRSHLTYCSNVHPGVSLEQVNEVVRDQIAKVRQLRGLESMGSGLWLGAGVSRELRSKPRELAKFVALLAKNRVELFTLNGFPFDDFHTRQVKKRVYRPDWSDPERLNYTLDLAYILTRCLPPHCREGSISTLPLGYAPDWDNNRHQLALTALCQLTDSLSNLRERTGRQIRVCLEMEPGCVLERTDQAIAFFNDELPAAAIRHGVSKEQLSRHLGLCYDICHQAVMFEDPAISLSRLDNAGIAIGKIQVSNALQLHQPAEDDPEHVLQEFSEPRYLHQVRTRNEHGELVGLMDLPEALIENSLPRNFPWRIHFHLPIQTRDLAAAGLGTTQREITKILDYLTNHPGLRPHLEVETYTWQVLPPRLCPSNDGELRQGLVNELHWLETEMRRRNLLADTTP